MDRRENIRTLGCGAPDGGHPTAAQAQPGPGRGNSLAIRRREFPRTKDWTTSERRDWIKTPSKSVFFHGPFATNDTFLGAISPLPPPALNHGPLCTSEGSKTPIQPNRKREVHFRFPPCCIHAKRGDFYCCWLCWCNLNNAPVEKGPHQGLLFWRGAKRPTIKGNSKRQQKLDCTKFECLHCYPLKSLPLEVRDHYYCIATHMQWLVSQA